MLEYAKNESLVRSQDYFHILFALSLEPEGTLELWSWVRNNWDYLVRRFTLNNRSLGEVLPALAFNFYTEERLSELQDFIAKHPEEGAGANGRLSAIESTKDNILLSKEHQPTIKALLRNLAS